MKTLALGLAVLAGTMVFLATLPCDNRAIAASGCCKERASEHDPWRKTGLDFSKCKAQKEVHNPGQNVFQPTGRYWWDVGC